MKKRVCFSLCLCICLCLFLTSCGERTEKFTDYSFEYFDTVTSVTGYAKSEEKFALVCADIFRQLSEYHKLFTIYHRYEGMENLCTINELKDGAHRTVKVDERIMDMLLFSKEMYEKTGGEVNIAMGSVLSIWHHYRTVGKSDPTKAELPPMDDLREAALHTDINHLILDEQNCTVTITDPKMPLERGYALVQMPRVTRWKWWRVRWRSKAFQDMF